MDPAPPGTMLWPDAEETVGKTAGAGMNAGTSAKCFCRVHHASGEPCTGTQGLCCTFSEMGEMCLTGMAEPALQY